MTRQLLLQVFLRELNGRARLLFLLRLDTLVSFNLRSQINLHRLKIHLKLVVHLHGALKLLLETSVVSLEALDQRCFLVRHLKLIHEFALQVSDLLVFD